MEHVIPRDQVTALLFPIQMTYDWFPSSGVLQMHLPSATGGGSAVDVRVNGAIEVVITLDSGVRIYGRVLVAVAIETPSSAIVALTGL